jgi:hypothetical protein
MAKTYRPYCPDQMFLLPPSPRDWLPENHLSYFVSDIVDNLNLEAIESYYEKLRRQNMVGFVQTRIDDGY